MGPCIHRIPVPGHWRPPVGEALVVLGGQDHVSERRKTLGWGGKETTEIFPSLAANPLDNHTLYYPLNSEANIRIREAFSGF